MTLIGILAALLLERGLSHWKPWRTHDLTGYWLTWIRQRSPSASFWQAGWGLGILVLFPVLVVLAALYYLIWPLPAILELAVGIAILLVCLGPRDMAEEISAYRTAREAGDEDRVQSIIADLIAGPGRKYGETRGRCAVAATFVQAHERWFGVILYFFVAGPLGAVLYRLSASVPVQLRQFSVEGDLVRRADSWHALLAWAPARVTALIYAMAGSSDDAFSAWARWRLNTKGGLVDTWSLLARVGLGSLARESEGEIDLDDALDSALSLLNRSLMILLAVLSLFTVGGWLA